MEFCVDAGSRSLNDDGLRLKPSVDRVDETVKKCSTLMKSCSCNLTEFIAEEDIHYKNSIINGLTLDKVLFNKISSIIY